MKKLLPFTLIILSLFFTACSDSKNKGLEFEPITDALLTGNVFGESFTAAGGKAFDRGGFISINITDIEADCESFIGDYDLFITINIPSQTGAGIYEGLNVDFHKKGETPLNFIGATAHVTSITKTEINIKINAVTGPENNIDGTFTVSYCN